MSSLAVWMNGTCIGELSQARGTLRFRYTAAGLEGGIGLPLVSVSMPTQSKTFRGDTVRFFFDGLLPEGEILRMLAHDFQVPEYDTMGLLACLGRDCAGALQVIDPETSPDPRNDSLDPITDEDIGDRLRSLRHSPLGVDDRVRISLAGVQEKMVLTKTADGWALPLDGTPSTHIFKPAHRLLPDSVTNEALCLSIARHAGIDAAQARLENFGGQDTLIIQRFDRTHDGPTSRIHQEDMCQAHSLTPRWKYEDGGGPSLRSCAQVLRDWTSGMDDIVRLLEQTVFNVAIGNADAHAKNISLLHDENGSLSLAPAYDLLSTRYYGQTDATASMFVNGVKNIDGITLQDLADEATRWGLGRDMALEIARKTASRIPDAVAKGAAEIPAPPALVEFLEQRCERLASQ